MRLPLFIILQYELTGRGLIGPRRLYGSGGIYNGQTFAALAGALLPIPVWLLVRKNPRSWARNINLPVALNGVLYIPPATGVNYASWLAVGAIFQFWIRRMRFAWWSKVCLLASEIQNHELVQNRMRWKSCLSYKRLSLV